MNRRTLLAAALAGTTAAAAQTQTSTSRQVHVISGTATSGAGPMVWTGEAGGGGGLAASTMHFIAAGNMDGKVVKGAPYSAEAITEMTRTLADGTRIVNKHTTQMARDKDGRTRRENNFANLSPFQSANADAPRMVTITDPVAREVFILNYNDKTARKIKMGEPAVFRSEKVEGNRKEIVEEKIHVSVSHKSEGGAPPPDVMFTIPDGPAPMGAVTAMRLPFDSKNSKSEKLPAQTMEGVRVEGTRNTHTIPAGSIGNDREIVSTNESWYSSDLQMVIFSKNTDPLVGETIYRVQNLRRAEPDPSLFKIPADFKLVENSAPAIFPMRRKMHPGERDEN